MAKANCTITIELIEFHSSNAQYRDSGQTVMLVTVLLFHGDFADCFFE